VMVLDGANGASRIRRASSPRFASFATCRITFCQQARPLSLPPGTPHLAARIRREETDECVRDGLARSRSSMR
jgi:hypothetical protein